MAIRNRRSVSSISMAQSIVRSRKNDKRTLRTINYNCEKRFTKRRIHKKILESDITAKPVPRRRRASSPLRVESECNFTTPRKVLTFGCCVKGKSPIRGQDQISSLMSLTQLPVKEVTKEEVPLPAVRKVDRLAPLRCTGRCYDEQTDLSLYIKRHEKPEKEEKQILRRDRIWQNEERHRARLLRKQCSPSPIPEYRLILYRKPPGNQRPPPSTR